MPSSLILSINALGVDLLKLGVDHLKAERIGDRGLALGHGLTTGPVPASGPERFFADRQAMYKTAGLVYEDWRFEPEDRTGKNKQWEPFWSRLPEICRDYDQIVFWVDPDANAQLVFIQLLDWLGDIPEISPRLWLKQLELPISHRRPGDAILPPRPIEPADLALAHRAWAAFRAPTPQAWAALADDPELMQLPFLDQAVHQMLDELPGLTGLGATARRILEVTESCYFTADDDLRSPKALITRMINQGKRLPFGYWELGQELCELATAPIAALSGLTESQFSLAMHNDETRFASFRASRVSLTEFGARLRDGKDDWAAHNTVHRWWGGTRLTNDTLWRWDQADQRLLAPGRTT